MKLWDSIHKIIYLLGEKNRNPSLRVTYNELIKTDFASRIELEDIQYRKLNKLISKAYRGSSFYREIMDKCGLKDGIISSLDDLRKFPILTKQDLIVNNENIQMSGGKFLAETSGSTGESLKFIKSEKWDSANRAAQYRGYSWYGVNPWEKNGYFWGYSFSKMRVIQMRIMDFLMNRTRLFTYNEAKIDKFINKINNAIYLEGYSSMIYEVAKKVNKNNHKSYNFKMIKGTSEKIFPAYQEEVKKAFGKKMISEYGSAEAGIIAFECPCGNMHVVMENVIVEEISGSCVVTNLSSDTFPIIRYKLGDAITLDTESQCACGRKSIIIKEVLGRVGKTIKGRLQEYPSLTLYYIFKNIAINEGRIYTYQVVQKEKGKLTFYIEQIMTEREKRIIINEGMKYWNEDIAVEIEDGSCSRNYKGKIMDFISYIE